MQALSLVCCVNYDVDMSKIPKTHTVKAARDARTGEFVVVDPAVKPKKFSIGQIRDAVRKVVAKRQAKA